MGRNDLEDIAILVGLGIVGVLAYQKFFPGKSAEEVLKELDTGMRAFLDSIKLPALPELPQLQFPIAQPVQATPQIPQSPQIPEPTDPAAEPTNSIPADESGPKVKEPVNKPPPEESGQLENNPAVPPPPSGSGGAIIGFAGDFDSNSKSQQTAQIMEKQGCQMVVGVGDYSYTKEKAVDWFNRIMGPRWKGKMKGCIGNHDVHDPEGFLREFGQTGWNMGVRVAPNLTVVFIDTEKGINAALLDSLTSAAKQQSKHVAYVFHKPFITSGNAHHKPSENKWSSIIDAAAKKHGVKLLIAGHNHLYEHFTCGGIHYVTSGAAGRKFYAGNCQGSCGPVKCVENTNGFLKVSVGASLLCQFISNSGQMLDSFQIT